jgi:hypothetical protein
MAIVAKFVNAVLQPLYSTLRSVYASCSTLATSLAMHDFRRGLLDECASKFHSCYSLSAILSAASSCGCGTFKADQATIFLIRRTVDCRLAHFYSFADAHVYNFDYSETFVETIVNSLQSLTFPQRSAKPSAVKAKVKSISDEEFDLVHYVPTKVDSELICISEFGFKHQSRVRGPSDPPSLPQDLPPLSTLEQQHSEMLRRELTAYMQQLDHFLVVIHGLLKNQAARATATRFHAWRLKGARSQQQSASHERQTQLHALQQEVLF